MFKVESVDKRALQKPSEVADMITALEDESIRSVVELGVYEGGMLTTLCRAWPDALVVGVDVNDPRQTTQWPLQPAPRATLIVGNSQSPSTRDAVLAVTGRPIGLVFIDGDHTLDGVLADYELWSPVARWVAFHDIIRHPGWDIEVAVDQLWARIKAARPTREFLAGGDSWAGIGLVRGGLVGDFL